MILTGINTSNIRKILKITNRFLVNINKDNSNRMKTSTISNIQAEVRFY